MSAAIAGDMAAADDVRLVLPETGVCSTQVNVGEPTFIGLLRRTGPERGGRLLRCRCGRQGREEVGLRLRGCRLRSDVPGQRSRFVLISALGFGQIFCWGSSYYLPAVLAKPIAAETGWPLAWMVAGLTIGSLTAGLISARVGHAIQARGGRPVMMAGTHLLAGGLTALGLSPDLPLHLLAWLVIGAGMGCSLYDAAFATLGRLYDRDARAAITHLTLFGGFASTVCWPLSAVFLEWLGWRGTCFAYAALHLGLTLPLYAAILPRVAEHAGAAAPKLPDRQGESVELQRRRQWLLFGLMAVAFSLGWGVSSCSPSICLPYSSRAGWTLPPRSHWGHWSARPRWAGASSRWS